MASETIETIILALSMVFLLVTGAILLIKGQNKNDKAQSRLGGAYLCLVLLYVVWGLNLTSRYSIIYFVQLLVFVAIVFFIKGAFYTDRKSSFPLVLALTIVFGLIQVGQKLLSELGYLTDFRNAAYYPNLDNILSILWTLIPFGWMALSAHKARNELKSQDVKPWILRRLLLVEITAIIEIFVSVPDLMNTVTEIDIGQPMWYLQIAIISSFAVINFFAWAMPSWFKNLLNKGAQKKKTIEQIESEDETKMSEEAIMQELMEVYQA